MELPVFKYNPNAYNLDLFEQAEGICSACNEKSMLKYSSSFYSIEEPDYICAWCISSGKASEMFEGEFNDYCGIEGVSPDPKDAEPAIDKELLIEVSNKTPSYTSWQQEVWLTHCNEPCAFIGYADSKTIEPIYNEVESDIINSGFEPKIVKDHLSKDGELVGYLFECLKCKQHRLHVDCS